MTALGLVLGVLPLSVAHAAVFSNDDFVNAEAISEASGSTSGSTADATAESGDPVFHPIWSSDGDLRGTSVWYTWTAPDPVDATSFAVVGEENVNLGVYTGTSLESLSELGFNMYSPVDGVWDRARVDFTPTAGQTYIIGVGQALPGTEFTLSWQPTPAAPANDDFATAPALPASASGSTVWATWESGEPTFGGDPDSISDLGGRTVWYTYAPTADGTVTISLEGSTFDTVLAVYTGSLGALTEIEFNDDADGHITHYTSEVTLAAQAGVTYHVGIGGWGFAYADEGDLVYFGDSGDFVLSTLFLPATPAAPTPVMGDQHVDLSWTAPADGGSAITGYTVAYKAQSDATWTYVSPDPATETSLTISGLTNGTVYSFMVMASNANGDSPYSEVAMATPGTVPGVPANVAVYAGDSSLSLYWVAPGDGGSPITTYTIAYRPVGENDWLTVTFDAPATSRTITGLANGANFEMKVMASNANGDGAYSEAVSRVVGLPPDPPEELAVTSTSRGAATLTWVEGSSNGSQVDGYQVYVYIFKKGTKNRPATYTPLDGYPYSTGTSNTYTVTGLQKKYTYVFTVKAHNIIGWSPESGYSLPFRG